MTDLDLRRELFEKIMKIEESVSRYEEAEILVTQYNERASNILEGIRLARTVLYRKLGFGSDFAERLAEAEKEIQATISNASSNCLGQIGAALVLHPIQEMLFLLKPDEYVCAVEGCSDMGVEREMVLIKGENENDFIRLCRKHHQVIIDKKKVEIAVKSEDGPGEKKVMASSDAREVLATIS